MTRNTTTCVAWALALLAWGLTMWVAGDVLRAAQPRKLPPWSKAARAVRQHFEAAEHPPHEIISRDQASAVLDRLARLGFRFPDRAQILEQVPAADEFLVTVLRTRKGRRFMAEIATYPHAYDRLDRLSRLPRGKQMVRDLIRGPDGYKLIEYMTTAPGGRELGRQLSKTPKGKDFNEPTGRIYTETMLVERLKHSYEALRRPAKANGRPPRQR